MQTVKWNMVDNDVVRSLPLLAAMGQFRVTDLSPKSEDLQYLSFIWVLWIACISDEDEWNGAAGSESYYEAMVEINHNKAVRDRSTEARDVGSSSERGKADDGRCSRAGYEQSTSTSSTLVLVKFPATVMAAPTCRMTLLN